MVPGQARLVVQHPADRFAAGALVERVAQGLGWERRAAQAAGVVACELASNAARYAGHGTLVAAAEGPETLWVTCWDWGPPFDVERSVEDHATADGPLLPEQRQAHGGLGCGLGAVRRLAARLEVVQDAHVKAVTALLTRARRVLGTLCPLVVRAGVPANPVPWAPWP